MEYSTLGPMPVFRLAIASPLRRLFDYLPPGELSTDELALLQPGIRVQVPFGRRQTTGILVEVSEHSEVAPEKLRAAIKLIDQHPIISESLLQLCLWASTYYKHSMGRDSCRRPAHAAASRRVTCAHYCNPVALNR